MFERYTDRARRVVVLAQEEARLLNHTYIGTEHLVLGLLHEGEGLAAQVLKGAGVTLDAARTLIAEIIGQGQQASGGHIPFTPRAKKVLELGLREALQCGHSYIGVGHLLLGVIREGEGVGAQVIRKLGADLDDVRKQVRERLATEGGETMGATRTEPHRIIVQTRPLVDSMNASTAQVYELVRDLERRLEHMYVTGCERVTTERHSTGEITETLTIKWRRQ